MAELPPQHQNPDTIDAYQQPNPAAYVEFGQPTDMTGELGAMQTPDMSAGLAPETDPVTGAIEVQEGPIAATGIEVAAETTGRHHRSDDQESAADVAIQTELTRLQHAKQNMINIFGQDAYQERFANNPNVDPDAFVSKLQNEAPAGRHAAGEDDPQEFLNTWGVSQEAYDAMSRDEQVKVLKGEYAQAGGEATEPAVSAEATTEEPVEAAREAVKQSLSDVAKEGVKLRWSEDEQPAPKQAQPKQDSPLTRAAKMGKLRAGWTDEEPDVRNAFLNRQRRRSRPFGASQRTKPRMRTEAEINALTAPLNSSNTTEAAGFDAPIPALEADDTRTDEEAKAAELSQTINTLLQVRRKHAAGEATPLERPADVEELAWEGATEAQRQALSDGSLNRLTNELFGMSLEDFDRVATDPAHNNPDYVAIGGTEGFLRDLANAKEMEKVYGSVFDRDAAKRAEQPSVRADGTEFRELTSDEIGELRKVRGRRRIGSRILRAVQGNDYNNRRAA